MKQNKKRVVILPGYRCENFLDQAFHSETEDERDEMLTLEEKLKQIQEQDQKEKENERN